MKNFSFLILNCFIYFIIITSMKILIIKFTSNNKIIKIKVNNLNLNNFNSFLINEIILNNNNNNSPLSLSSSLSSSSSENNNNNNNLIVTSNNIKKIEIYNPYENKYTSDYNNIDLNNYKYIHILIDLEDNNENNNENNDSNENNEKKKILLIEGKKFHLNNNNIQINNYNLTINEEIHGREQGTGLNIWDGSIVLAKYLERNQNKIQNKYVIEIGAGTGTTGLASLLLGSTLVVLTDLSYTLDNLRSNQQQAQNLLIQSSSSLLTTTTTSITTSNELDSQENSNIPQSYVLPLDWSDPSTYIFPNHIKSTYPKQWDVILGADIVWLDHLIPALIMALKSLATENTIVYLSHQTRSHHTDDLFFTQLKKYFDVKLIPKDELNPEFSSDKINVYECKLHPIDSSFENPSLATIETLIPIDST